MPLQADIHEGEGHIKTWDTDRQSSLRAALMQHNKEEGHRAALDQGFKLGQ